MKLQQLLATLTTENVQVSLVDMETGRELVQFKLSGYASLDDTIESREVMQWSIISATALKVVLGEILQTTNDPNTDPTGDP